jgi:hypothetical protein
VITILMPHCSHARLASFPAPVHALQLTSGTDVVF